MFAEECVVVRLKHTQQLVRRDHFVETDGSCYRECSKVDLRMFFISFLTSCSLKVVWEGAANREPPNVWNKLTVAMALGVSEELRND